MTNSRSTRRALIGSTASIVLCLAMLIGTTFAWFSDSVSSGANTITAGDLDVELQDAAGTPLTQLEWVAADSRDAILWEPGAAYDLTPFRIANTGALALRYKLVVTGLNARSDSDVNLLEVIDFTVQRGEDPSAPLTAWEGVLLPAGTAAAEAADGAEIGTTAPITITATMRSDADIKYANRTLDGIRIAVYAVQYDHESDSFDGRYDEDARNALPVTDFDSLKTALTNGGEVTLAADVTADAEKTELADRVQIKQPTVLTLDAMYTVPGELEPTSNWAALYISADTTINASENGGINCLDKTDSDAAYSGCPYAAHITGGTVTVNGGTYYAGGTVFNVEQGTLIVNGGFFRVAPDVDMHDCRYLLNCIDESYKNGTAQIIVRGGTFVNFDPSNCTAEGANTNFVADGYKVTSTEQPNGEVWNTVVAETE